MKWIYNNKWLPPSEFQWRSVIEWFVHWREFVIDFEHCCDEMATHDNLSNKQTSIALRINSRRTIASDCKRPTYVSCSRKTILVFFINRVAKCIVCCEALLFMYRCLRLSPAIVSTRWIYIRHTCK